MKLEDEVPEATERHRQWHIDNEEEEQGCDACTLISFIDRLQRDRARTREYLLMISRLSDWEELSGDGRVMDAPLVKGYVECALMGKEPREKAS